MNGTQLPENSFFSREYDSHTQSHSNQYPSIPRPNQLVPHQQQLPANWQSHQQIQQIQQHYPVHPQIQLQNSQFHQHALSQQTWQQSQQQQQQQQQRQQQQHQNQFIHTPSFEQQQQRAPFEAQQHQQRAPSDVQHQPILHPQQMPLLNVAVPQSPFADQIVVKAIIEGTQRGATYKQALEALHGMGGHGGHMWKDYYLDSAARLNETVRQYINQQNAQSVQSTQNGITTHTQDDLAQKKQKQQQQPQLQNNNATASSSRMSSKQPQPNPRSSQQERKSATAPVNATSRKRNTLNSMTAHTAVFTDKLPAPHAELKIPDPPSRSPTPPTKTIVKGGRNLYTQEDRDYFINFLTWTLKKDPDLTRQELCEMLAEKVPSHTAASWASHWSSRHDIADKILNSYAGIETGESFSSSSDEDDSEDDDDDGDDNEPPPRGTRSRPARTRRGQTSVSAPVRRSGRPLRSRNRRKDTSSEEDESEESDGSTPSETPPRRRARPPKPASPKTAKVKVKAEPVSDMDRAFGDSELSDSSDVNLDGFDPGNSEEDEKNMGESGGPYTAADQRVIGRHIGNTKNWHKLSSKERWGSFTEKHPARAAKSWGEYYRRNEKTINTFATKYKKYKLLHPNGQGRKPQSIAQQKGRPSWATGSAPKRKFNLDINSGDGEARRKVGKMDGERAAASIPPSTPASVSSPITLQHAPSAAQSASHR